MTRDSDSAPDAARIAFHQHVIDQLPAEDLAELDRLVAAVRQLDLAPRALRWDSLAACVVHAASGNGRDDPDVRARVQRALAAWDVRARLLPAADAVPTGVRQLEPLLWLMDRLPADLPVEDVDVARSYAQVLAEHGVERLDDIEPLMRSPRRFDHVDATLRALPGSGHGRRTSHLWLLAGENRGGRPDAAVQRWLEPYDGGSAGADEARLMITMVAARLSATGRPTSE